MKKLYFAVVTYTVLGLFAGLYYRELTKAQEFTGDTQLSIVHTHLLTLGTIFLLIALILEKVFALSSSRWFNPFFWTFNTGILVTTAMMVVNGTMTVVGSQPGAMISGIAGLGHILLTIGLVFLLSSLYRGVSGRAAPERELDGTPVSS